MTKHMTGTREEWLAARLELLEVEKELTRRGDELARRRRELPWVRIDKEYRFETDGGSASLADLFRGRSQLLVYHFMFGPDYTAGCPSCSAIADGFDGFVVHLANHDVTLSAVSRAPLAKLQAYKRQMEWTFPWASSLGSDFNADFNVWFTEQEQREGGIEYNYRHGGPGAALRLRGDAGPVAEMAAMTGTDVATYTRERPGMSAFVLEDGVAYHTYSTYARGLDGLWGMYQWLDRGPPRGAMRRASGGAATTSTTSAERGNRGTRDLTTHDFRASFPARLLRRLGAALRRQRGGDDRLLRVHVGGGRDADARRLDDVDGVDADARTDVARRGGVVSWHVGRDDGGNDAAVPGPDAVALSPGRRQDRRDTPGSADRAGRWAQVRFSQLSAERGPSPCRARRRDCKGGGHAPQVLGDARHALCAPARARRSTSRRIRDVARRSDVGGEVRSGPACLFGSSPRTFLERSTRWRWHAGVFH